MAQYFNAVLVDNDRVFLADPRQYANGRQIMEHSYIGNDFMSAVLTTIKNHPMRVGWLGNQATAEDKCAEEFSALLAQKEPEGLEKVISKIEDFDFIGRKTHPAKYLINHDKREYLDLKKYSSRSFYMMFDQSSYGMYTGGIMCVNPLALLTAISNGRDDTDYYGHSSEYVGYWAGDLISVSEQLPDGLTEILPCFISNKVYEALKEHPGWKPPALREHKEPRERPEFINRYIEQNHLQI